MKKYAPLFYFTLLIFFLELLGVVTISTPGIWVASIYNFRNLSVILLSVWFCGTVFLLIKKGRLKKQAAQGLKVCNMICLSLTLVFFALFILALTQPYQGSFSTDTSLFAQKNVMIVVPHQDDDINLMGGLIEQYTDSGSEVTVVFSTNGDRYGKSEVRAEEAVSVLTALGVEKNNICYLGFGDQWVAQSVGGTETGHIYNSSDPDLIWTSLHGATETYGTTSIDCHQKLPYTRNNYVAAFQSVILERMPDTIFAVDFDSHVDHRATDLLFEEALCNVLTQYPDYHPQVYKGFCYGTAWEADADFFDSFNLLSTKKPEDSIWASSAYGYTWEDKVRFPISETNLNPVLFRNSVAKSLGQYRSQDAYSRATQILNGDKVFWERRTDSLLYNAQIFVDTQKTYLLNDFKLKDSLAIAEEDCINSGFEALQNKTITVRLEDAITINNISLYDNPDPDANILAGYITFSDGSTIDFSGLNKDGNATALTFPDKQMQWMEIVVTAVDSTDAGLSEIEAFYDTAPIHADTYIMAVDKDDNFVYDYILHGEDTVAFNLYRFPDGDILNEEDISLSLESAGNGASCAFEGDTLTVTCEKGNSCTIRISDSISRTTFTVSNPGAMKYAYMTALRFVDKTLFNLRSLSLLVVEYLTSFIS